MKTTTKLLNVLGFIEQYSLEPKLFFRIPYGLAQKDYAELSFCADIPSHPWTIKFEHHRESFTCDKTTLLEMTKSRHVDHVKLEQELAASVLSQANFARTFIETASNLYGSHRMEQSFRAHEEFKATLLDTVNEILQNKDNNESTGKLHIVKENDE